MRRRRRLATAAALPWAVWTALRMTGAERGFPFVPAMTFTPYAAAAAVLPLVLAVRSGSRTAALLSAGSGTVLATAVLSHRRTPGPAALPGCARLRVATVSLRKGLVPPAPVVDLVRRLDVDVLSVQELTPRAEAGLCAAGLGELLPWSHVIPARPGTVVSGSGAVWSRLPIGKRGAVPGSFEQPTVRLAVEGAKDVELTAVHSMPPATSPRAVREWTRDLADLPAPDPEVLRVLAGDFNATLDHGALRAVLRTGWADAAQRAGRGLAWTWRPLRLPWPRLALDHVLIDPRIAVAGVDLVHLPGSDHRVLVVDLALPPG
ncbi:endonuclease/exonuclease/phosphatase family protein [Blastococcus sp. CT_GayMR16]|nr:endonuclease/exonuclease/phosphatase family protein [Blastococcus sp. CT_GayMR16]